MAQNPIVTITMEDGGIVKLELYPETAPVSVNNFISLVQKKFYDGLIFHRVIKGFMIQGGCPVLHHAQERAPSGRGLRCLREGCRGDGCGEPHRGDGHR